MQSPIELPTKRHSFQNPRPDVGVDIHDPQWIPVLNSVAGVQPYMEKELSPYNSAPFSPFSGHSAQRPSQSHTYSRSATAPESIAPATRASKSPTHDDTPPLPPLPPSPTKFELPAARPTSEFFQHKSAGSPPREEGKDESTDTEATTESTTDQSTVGTASLLDEQTYSIPGQPLSAKDVTPKDDNMAALPALPLSTHSSFSSLRKGTTTTSSPLPSIPTSRYSRKPVPRNSTTVASTRVSSVSPTLNDQPPRVSSLTPLQQEQAQAEEVPPSPPIPSPAAQSAPSPNIHSPKPSTTLAKSPLSTSIQASKSTASQRRHRALHSHPSRNSIGSRRNSWSSEQDVPFIPAPVPQVRSRPSSSHKVKKSTDSRIHPNASFTSLAPTPAPTTPLPQLPPHAITSDNDADALPKSPPAARIAAERENGPKGRADHARMASFMTTNQTVIFRRFDDVHVQLLLCLQDEITELERKLNTLDDASMTRSDRTLERMQVIRELRRVVSEYDQLFASWSSMQATKASKTTLASLKAWLERPQTSAGAGLGRGAQQDLLWLERANDLSSVNLGPQANEKVDRDRKGSISSSAPMSRIPNLFGSCAGRRK